MQFEGLLFSSIGSRTDFHDNSDNTNATQEVRAYWVALAKESNIPIRCVHFLASSELCKHNAAARASNKELVRAKTVFSFDYSIFPLGDTNTQQLMPLLLSPIQNPESRQTLPGIAFIDYARRYQVPALDEGFADIIPVEFRFRGTEDEKKLWSQYWI